MNIYQYHNRPEQLEQYRIMKPHVKQMERDDFWTSRGKPYLVGRGIEEILNSADYSYLFARFINKPFPKGEEIIATVPEMAYQYAKYVLDGEFPKGEDAIATSARHSLDYARFTDKRFKKGEAVIKEIPLYAWLYAAKITKNRFIEAEDNLRKSKGFWEKYTKSMKGLGIEL